MEIGNSTNIHDANQIVEIHLAAFPGFFLSSLGRGFLRYLYKGFILHPNSGVLVAKDENQIVGFLAYSIDPSDFYSFLLKHYFFPFAWYGFLGALRSPISIMRIIRALRYPSAKKIDEKYIKINSIAVDPTAQAKGIGAGLIKQLCEMFKDSEFQVIRLETDAENNEAANTFYQKNGFEIEHVSNSPEGRKMNHCKRQISNSLTFK